ncbi:hypothetical protein SBA3_3730013 [Candidatus Sulfopaludibacter sp. SbA3]|nr:hypothetical protein SBA3_3730013 [Candidatus Sulfopaludibacter sp. SbA3]
MIKPEVSLVPQLTQLHLADLSLSLAQRFRENLKVSRDGDSLEYVILGVSRRWLSGLRCHLWHVPFFPLCRQPDRFILCQTRRWRAQILTLVTRHRPGVAFACKRLPAAGGVTEDAIRAYMSTRIKEEASGRTINMEVGELSRAIGKKWSVLWPKVPKQEERKDVGKALSPAEENRLLAAADKKARWKSPRPSSGLHSSPGCAAARLPASHGDRLISTAA